jgi:hypothetical protein
MSGKAHVWSAGAVAAMAVLATLVGLIWPDVGAWFATENGPVESLSVVVWLTVGACLLLMHRPSPAVALALAVVCVNLAVREQGLPPELVPSGKALIQWSHYLDPATPGTRRLAEALAVGGSVLAGLVTAWHLLAFMWGRQGWRTPVGRLLMAAFGVLLASQGLDHWLGEDVLYEEILECVGALLTLVAVQALHQRHQRPMARAEVDVGIQDACSRAS